MSLEVRGTFLGMAAGLGVLGMAFALSPFLHAKKAANSARVQQANAASATATAMLVGEAARGYSLFDRSCAPCHGEDARGDEGPNLHNLAKSDARISTIVKGGVKGEMPAFAEIH